MYVVAHLVMPCLHLFSMGGEDDLDFITGFLPIGINGVERVSEYLQLVFKFLIPLFYCLMVKVELFILLC